MIMFKDRSVSKIHTLITLPYKKSKTFHGKPWFYSVISSGVVGKLTPK